MKSRAEIKQEAKDLLRGNWGKAIGLTIIPLLLQWFTSSYQAHQNFLNGAVVHYSFITFILGVLAWGFGLGVTYTFLDWVRNPERTINPMPDMVRVIGSAAVFGLLVQAILVGLIVGIATILLIVPGIIVWLMLSQSIYVYKDLHDANPEASVWSGISKSLSLSESMMVGHKWEFFVMQLSFIGWWILGGLSLGIGLIWISPYYEATMAAYYDELEANSDVQVVL